MDPRRYVLTLVLVGLAACKLFRPVDPNAPKAPAPARQPPADTRAAPAERKDQPAAKKDADKKAQPKPEPARKEARSTLTDANIAAMVLASNYTDISYARLAPSRAERADVKEFAQRMLTDHTGVNQLVNDLLTKLNLTPVDNTASLDMRDESATKRDLMRELTAYAFDSTYMENELAYHQRFLSNIDTVLLPAAKHPDLRALLTAVRPAVAAHLSHAEQVRANVVSRK